MRDLTQEEIDELSPGIRGAVLRLREMGYETIDSGDGSNHAAGMECAVEYPMVVIRSRQTRLIMDAQSVLALLQNDGVKISRPGRGDTEPPAGVQVEASYNPADGHAFVVVTEFGNEGHLARLKPLRTP